MMIATLLMAGGETATHVTTLTFDPAAIGHVLRLAASVISIVIGLFFMLAGTLGVLRLPDFYTRIHAAGMTDTLGAEMIILGLIIQSGFSQLSLKLLFVAFLMLLTGPTATHAVANAAHKMGLKPKLGPYQSPDVVALRQSKGKS